MDTETLSIYCSYSKTHATTSNPKVMRLRRDSRDTPRFLMFRLLVRIKLEPLRRRRAGHTHTIPDVLLDPERVLPAVVSRRTAHQHQLPGGQSLCRQSRQSIQTVVLFLEHVRQRFRSRDPGHRGGHRNRAAVIRTRSVPDPALLLFREYRVHRLTLRMTTIVSIISTISHL